MHVSLADNHIWKKIKRDDLELVFMVAEHRDGVRDTENEEIFEGDTENE